MSEKRRDNKNRILRTGESQRKDGRYVYKYVDVHGKQKFVYAWTLVPTDRIPAGKRSDLSLREKEKTIQKELADGISHIGKDMTVFALYEKYTRYKANVCENTMIGRKQLKRILCEDSIGIYPIVHVRLSDAKEWALRMKMKGYSYQTVSNYKRSLKAAFYMAVQDDYLRKNPFDFPISDVLEDDRKPKLPLSSSVEKEFLSFLEHDKVYHKYYDDVVILLGTGLRISEFCGLRDKDIDLGKQVIIIDHQLLRNSHYSYCVTRPKTDSSIRKIPMSTKVSHAVERVLKRQKQAKTFSVNGYHGFLFLNRKGMPRTSADYASIFQRIARKYNRQNEINPLPSPFTAHILRHTFCTKLAYTGMNPKALQYIMGHKNITMTLNYYAHSNAEMAINEMKKYIE
ncbi:site-specific integrase [Enterococcus sp. AN402]|uniref:site-specific integrase n=1 Tax=Enterococcus sp. AN402 TaxID=3151386 RepID=UPI00345794A1